MYVICYFLLLCSFKVLYLYDNQIERIENLDLAVKLDQLYLNNNQIKELPQLKLEALTKIHLEDNDISFVVGLDSCQKLRELYISNQRLPLYMALEFDDMSLQAVSNSLEVLDVSGNGISILNQFLVLRSMSKFICENNAVNDITEMEMIVGLRRLKEVSFKGNAACFTQRYRDKVIAASSNALESLDNMPVHPHQKVAIKGLKIHRENLNLQSTHTTVSQDEIQ
jgi:protein phosphatase 1 regulatory subunit 42